MALLASPIRAVERERSRFQVRHALAAVRTSHLLRIDTLRAIHHRHHHQPARQFRRRLDRRFHPLLHARLQEQPVHDDLNRVVAPLVQHDLLIEPPQRPVDPRPHKPRPGELLQLLLVLPLAPPHHRGQDHHPFFHPQGENLLQNLLRRLARDRGPAVRTMRLPNRRPEQSEVVVDLRDRPHRRSRTAVRRLLLDRNRRTQPVNRVHVRTLHLVQKLPRIGRQRLHVAPLPFRIDRVEGQRRLARSAQPRDHRQRVPRDLHADVLQIVHPRPMHGDALKHGRRRPPFPPPSLRPNASLPRQESVWPS